MARPRSISDERLLAAAGVVIGRAGPGFTLAEVAAEAGVAVGTAGQRFGSKKGLLQALSRLGTRQSVDLMRARAVLRADAVEGLRAALVSVYSDLGDAATAANHLGQLGADISDPELRSLVGEHYAAIEAEVILLVHAAAPSLPGVPGAERAARMLLAVINGGALDWSIRPNGSLTDRLEEDVDAVLTAWART